jgi:hypothetical protein
MRRVYRESPKAFSLSRRLKFVAALAAGLLFAPSAHSTPVTFFTTQAALDAAVHSAVLLEDIFGATPDVKFEPTLVLPSGSYTGLEGSPGPHVLVASPGYTNFGAQVGTTTQFILTASGEENILVAFSTPHYAVGFDAFYNGLGPLTLTVLGAGNSVLDTLAFATGLNLATGLADKGCLGFSSTVPVYGFQWDTTAGSLSIPAIPIFRSKPPCPVPFFSLLPASLSSRCCRGARDRRKRSTTTP